MSTFLDLEFSLKVKSSITSLAKSYHTEIFF